MEMEPDRDQEKRILQNHKGPLHSYSESSIFSERHKAGASPRGWVFGILRQLPPTSSGWHLKSNVVRSGEQNML
jgi:hypothetical protein